MLLLLSPWCVLLLLGGSPVDLLLRPAPPAGACKQEKQARTIRQGQQAAWLCIQATQLRLSKAKHDQSAIMEHHLHHECCRFC